MESAYKLITTRNERSNKTHINHFKMRTSSLRFKTFLLCILSLSACTDPAPLDVVVKNATIYDGRGLEPFVGDVGIKDDMIAQIGRGLSCDDCTVIDARGLAISPGFIDIHTHIEPLPQIPDGQSFLHMGVTTCLGGPDGSSPLNLDRYLNELDSIGTGVNVGYLIGHNSIRAEVMGLDDRSPSDEELEEMKAWINKGMEDGAFGMSTGLKYLPGTFAETEEIVELAKVASKYGGIYTSHLREEGLGLLEGVDEAIEISDKADIRVVLTHHKVVGQPMWGSSEKTLAMVDSARSAGLDVRIDQYPYTASYTNLGILIPAWSMAGGRYDKFAERCKDPILRDSIKQGIIFNIINDRGGNDLKRVQLAAFDWKPHLEGKTLYDWAIEEGLEPTPENGAELIINAQINRGAGAIFHAMEVEDLKNIMTHPMTSIASDGRLTKFSKGFPHPRVHGTFPRVLGKYARDEGFISMTEAIRKMTSLPASTMGLTDRGIIKVGNKADLVIFDDTAIIDKADFSNPHQYPEGIHKVIVNGQMALENGALSEQRYGYILRRE